MAERAKSEFILHRWWILGSNILINTKELLNELGHFDMIFILIGLTNTPWFEIDF